VVRKAARKERAEVRSETNRGKALVDKRPVTIELKLVLQEHPQREVT
jgi:hypothetical protein